MAGSVDGSAPMSDQAAVEAAGNLVALENQAALLISRGQFREAEALYRRLLAAGLRACAVYCNLAAICGMQGRLNESVQLLAEALRVNPDHPDAHNNLGSALKGLGDLDGAIASYREAVRLNPSFVDAHQNLGRALKEAGRLADAAVALRRALELNPRSATLCCRLADLLQAQDDGLAAIDLYRRAVQLDPSHVDACYGLANALRKQGDARAAVGIYRRAIAINPGLAEVYNNLGNALQDLADHEAAITAYGQALALRPTYAEAHFNLGNALQECRRCDAAMESYRRAIEFKPDCAEAFNGLANCMIDQGNHAEAMACYERALLLKPSYPEAHHNLAIAFHLQGRLDRAVAAYRKALEFQPDYPNAQKNLAMVELLLGDYTSGLARYEHRLRAPGFAPLLATPPTPRWDGRPLGRGDRLVLIGEQGLGDTLQFMRYVIPLRRQGVNVSLCAQPRLHGLIRASGLDQEPLTPEQACRVSDALWLPLLSLPRHLGVSPEHPLVVEPYIQTSPALMASWRDRLSGDRRPIIGLNWQGNPDQERGASKGRSLPLECFAPIAERTEASLLSLQKGSGSEQLQACSFADRFVGCQGLISDAWDFLETAAIVATCDLVITSDTSVAHLAAGMGRPTWLLLQALPEWRWGLEGETSFWYPSMRLFRQAEPGNWAELIERVVGALSGEALGSSPDRLSPPIRTTTH